MRRKRWLGAVLIGALVLGLGAVAPSSEPARFGGALPFSELEGSPIMLLPGTVMFPPVDLPAAMVALDVENDGKCELIAGGDFLHIVYIHEGKPWRNYLTAVVGFGKFVGPGQGKVKLGVRTMAAGEVDGDGLSDLVVATQDGKLWVLSNHHPWGFQWEPSSPYEITADHIFLFDHEGEGDLDVVLGWASQLRLLKNDGTGKLGSPEAIPGLEGRLRAGAEGIYAGERGLFLLTDRGLWFWREGELAVEAILEGTWVDLAVGDFTGLGRADVALVRYEEVWIYPGVEGGLGEPRVLKTEHMIDRLRAGDFNGDGLWDLLAISSSPGGFSAFYNHPEFGFLGPFWHGVEVPALRGLPAAIGLAVVADFTGDGRDDLAVAANFGHIAFFSAEPKGRSLQAIPGSFLLGSADWNNDGYPDLLTSTAKGGVAVLVNSGWGTFGARELLGPSEKDRMPYRAKLGDVTGDGKEELVVFEFSEDWLRRPVPGKAPWEWPLEWSEARVTVWDLEKKEVIWSEPLGAEIRPVLVLSDQTGDGVLDAVAGVGQRVLILSHGYEEWMGRMIPRAMRREVEWGGPVGPLVGLGDGSVAGLRVGLKVSLLLLRAGEAVETGIDLELSPFDLIACDLNGDGSEDLVALGWGAQEGNLVMALAVLWGDGEGFRPEVFPLAGWPALALPFPYGGLAAADLDGDGELELAAMRLPDREGNPGGVVVIPWTAEGPGELVLLPGCVGTGLLALDLDGDGKAELLSVQAGLPARLCLTSWEVER